MQVTPYLEVAAGVIDGDWGIKRTPATGGGMRAGPDIPHAPPTHTRNPRGRFPIYKEGSLLAVTRTMLIVWSLGHLG